MNKIDLSASKNQTDFNDEIRRLCRIAVERIGGLRRFAETIGENEGLWTNRLTEGRVVGFDVKWLDKVFAETGDHNVLMPFFRHGHLDRQGILTKIAQKLNYYALLIEKFKVEEKKTLEDTNYLTAQHLLRAAQKILAERGK